jgi:hypothetical protein
MENEIKKRTRQKHGDRLLLSPEAVAALKGFDAQIESAFGQTVSVNHKDKVTFLLRQRGTELTADDLAQIRALYFDEVKAVETALKELKIARANGNREKISDVMKKLAAPHVIENKAPKRPRVARFKRTSTPSTSVVSSVDPSATKA